MLYGLNESVVSLMIDYKDNFIGLSKDLLEARALNEKEVKILSFELDKMGKLYSVLQIVK